MRAWPGTTPRATIGAARAASTPSLSGEEAELGAAGAARLTKPACVGSAHAHGDIGVAAQGDPRCDSWRRARSEGADEQRGARRASGKHLGANDLAARDTHKYARARHQCDSTLRARGARALTAMDSAAGQRSKRELPVGTRPFRRAGGSSYDAGLRLDGCSI